MENLSIYNQARSCPKEAQREIQAGRLKGKSDINPVWRIKTLTELFGPCGWGWKYSIDRQWLEPGANGEIVAFCNISLFVKIDGQWSDAIPGTGGSAFIANERGGQYTSDEGYKMALTDAISVSCKALGIAADVYWANDPTKYSRTNDGGVGDGKQRTASAKVKNEYHALQKADYDKVVEAAAKGKKAKSGEDYRTAWQKMTNAGPKELKVFDEDVLQFKINNNL